MKISDLKNYTVVSSPDSVVTPTKEPKKTLKDKIFNTGTDVSDFLGFKGVSEQYGADIARSQADTEQEKNLVEFPKQKEVIGSAIQGASNFLPGVGKGASLGVKALAGAGLGYGIDVGSDLQENKTVRQALTPGINTAIGSVLPVASKIIGVTTQKASEKLAKNLEIQNLRLTPKDKAFIEKTDNGFTEWLTNQKITGNPAQRYSKIDNIYNGLEEQVQKTLKEGGQTISKDEFVNAVKGIPDNFIDDPQLFDESQRMVDRLIKTAQEKYADNIPLDFVNDVKRNYGKRAFDKAAQQVVNDSSYQISQDLYDLIKTKAPELESLNDEYSRVILAKKLMYKALGRQQLGIVGKIAASAVGATIGSSLGGPVGAGVGIIAGEKAASNLLGTKTRSNLGAIAKKLSEQMKKPAKNGKYQINKKLLMQLLSQIDSK